MTKTNDPGGESGRGAVLRLAAAVAEHLEGEYAATRPEDRADGDLLLRARGDDPRFGPEVTVEELPDADPTVVVDAVAAAAKRGRFALLVADPPTAREARAVLTDPPGAESVDSAGNRTFYHVPDRLRVGEAGFGAVRADGDLVWRETSETGISGEERTRIVLEADGRVQAAFDAYADLACPAPTAFPYAYRRGPDKRIHVTKAGREVGVYTSIREMRADAYVPVPDPLVPEIHLPDEGDPSGGWAVAAVSEDGAVEFLTE
jgi:hypothetical protein